MKTEGHREAGEQLENSIKEHEKYGEHPDKHQQLPGFLRKNNEVDVAIAFETIDGLRAGRFYGRKGNGNIVKQILENLEEITRWLK